jgi:hypothetical protein
MHPRGWDEFVAYLQKGSRSPQCYPREDCTSVGNGEANVWNRGILDMPTEVSEGTENSDSRTPTTSFALKSDDRASSTFRSLTSTP